MEESNIEQATIPPSLYVVIAIFVVLGFEAIYSEIQSLRHGNLSIQIGLLFLPCAYGLSQLNSKWRTISIVLSMLYLLINAVSAGMFFVYSESINILDLTQLIAMVIAPIIIYAVLVSNKIVAAFENEH
jgi:hypothetical protein